NATKSPGTDIHIRPVGPSAATANGTNVTDAVHVVDDSRRSRGWRFFPCLRLVDCGLRAVGVPVVSLSVTLDCIVRYVQPVAVSHWDTTSPTPPRTSSFEPGRTYPPYSWAT